MRILTFFIALLVPLSAWSVDIQKIVSPNLGVEAWLVESHQLPMVNVQVSFKSGSIYDGDKMGVSNLTASLISEGSGNMSAKEFTEEVEKIGALFSARPSLLSTTFSMRMLTEHKQKSFELLGQALTKPTFEKAPFRRIQDVVKTSILAGQQNPSQVASLILKEELYKNHPYGQPVAGTLSSVKDLTRFDLKKFYDQNYTLKNMVVSVVGDITPVELEEYLDQIFKDFKAGEKENIFPNKTPNVLPVVAKKEMNVPQSTIYLAHKGITREDPDYYAAYAMNYILGGGGFNSRLMEEIREKRGLAYGVYSYFEPLPGGGAFIANVSTKNKDAEVSIQLIKSEMKRLKKEGVIDAEFEGAMSYLKGSFPLRLDSSSKVLGYLETMQLHGLGEDYLELWVERVSKVKKEDIQRVAQRLLHEGDLMTVIVGGVE